MNMHWLESVIYGLFSGVSEFLPISSTAHQQIMLHLFGVDARDPVRDFFVHFGMLVAAAIACRSFLEIAKREISFHRRKTSQNTRALFDWRLIQSAMFPMLIGMLILRYVLKLEATLLLTAFYLIVNGVILFIPNRMVQGNKTACSMSSWDSLLIGGSGALSIFCGISRMACTYGTAVIRGAAKKNALLWSLVLSIYALALLCLMDLITAFSTGTINFWGSFLTYILSGFTSYVGSQLGISIIRYLTKHPSNNGFAYYCWGASLFSFILYLTVA